MHATPFFLPSEPQWQQLARARLAVGLLVATFIIALALAMVRFPAMPLLKPGPEILLHLLPEIVEKLAETPLAEIERMPAEPAAAAPAEDNRTDASREPPDSAGAVNTAQDPPDWYGLLKPAAKAAVDEMERSVGVNPTMDAKRRAAAEQFYPSLAPDQRQIWDNVETDQLGRKILWSGDCYRIIDDPSPANYEIWREFQQYFIYCKFGKSDPRMLPWVEGIQDRYFYLKYPDGEIPEEELRKVIERR